MPVFEYKAVTSTGKSTKGSVDAASTSDARAKLRKSGIFLTEIKEIKGGEESSSPGQIRFGKKVSSQDISIMTRQLATLIGSGVPLVESLTALVEQVENVTLKQALSDVKEKVNEGSTLADAMKGHRSVFSNLFVNMVRAGEASGALEIVLNRLADYSENQDRLRGKIRSTMAYPIIMILIGIAAMFVIFTFVIPKLVQLYDSMGQELPLPTQILIGISEIFVGYWYLVIIGAIIGFMLFRAYINTDKGRFRFDKFKLNMPLFGPLFRMVSIARFANTLSTLLASGVPILLAMDIVKNVVNNVVLANVIQSIRVNVSEGDSIAEPLKRSGEFPPLVSHMIAIGEKTGEVESMLEKVSQTYDNQVDARVSTLTSLLEPIMIVVMSVVIGAIVFSVMLPIFQMNEAIR